MRILVVEDNAALAANLVDYLESRGHQAEAVGNGRRGLNLAIAEPYEVIVLDLALPGMDGVEVCRRLREAGVATPVIMLTARGELEEKLAGIDSGADDYLVKPVALAELEARARAQVRRVRGELASTQLTVGDLVLDEEAFEVRRGDTPVPLAPADFRLLRTLMRAAPRVVPRQELDRALWGEDVPGSDTLRAHIHRLRCAIDRPFGRDTLRTRHGIGYYLVADGNGSP
ncbi:response regulator transcription factor [Arhodomonas sp. SL1]|uniref:response regulator transcription factor n=1 Tax=Arhodomonas sp. SL1 TaxID=3425691 RepID=UPI003F8805A3